LLVKDVDSNPSFSHDGQRFVFLRANDPDPGKYHLIITNADGATRKASSPDPWPTSLLDAAWAPDGKTVVGAIIDQTGDSLSSVISIDPETGKQRTISKPPFTFINKVSWLPDGSALAVIVQSADTNFNRQQVGLVSYPEGKFRPITADTNDYATLSVSSDGKTIATLMQQSVRDVYVSSGQKADYSDAKQITSGDPVPAISWAAMVTCWSSSTRLFV
jgi:dipeptidyl aminopeptidase/acylaminoacyl peptidase